MSDETYCHHCDGWRCGDHISLDNHSSGAIRPEDYDFLSNRQSTFEQQENMTVVPNYDAECTCGHDRAVHFEAYCHEANCECEKFAPANPESCVYLGWDAAVKEVYALRSRLTAVEQELAEARKDSERLEFLFEEWAAHHVKDNETGEQNYRLDYETGWCMTYRGAIDAEIAELGVRVIMRGERT